MLPHIDFNASSRPSNGVFVSPFADLFTSNASPEKAHPRPAAPVHTHKPASALPARLQPKNGMPTRERSPSTSEVDSPTSGSRQPPAKKKKRKHLRAEADAKAAAEALARALAAGGKPDEDLEEGEIEEVPLFFVDDTPAAIADDAAFVIDTEGAGPVADSHTLADADGDDADEAYQMLQFAKEVANTSDEDDDSSESESDDEGEQVVFRLDGADGRLADTDAALQAAIQGKIVDDSAAKVTGRYYKEADLTKSCALCGGECVLVGPTPPLPNTR